MTNRPLQAQKRLRDVLRGVTSPQSEGIEPRQAEVRSLNEVVARNAPLAAADPDEISDIMDTPMLMWLLVPGCCR